MSEAVTGDVTPSVSPFVPAWRRDKSAAFDLAHNSTARRTIDLDLWGARVEIYANANLSIYSAQACNARCPFCVEELRPASRGTALADQKRIEVDDELYFARLDNVLTTLRPLDPSVSVTGGEPSRDPRLPRTLRLVAAHDARKLAVTTNGSGLLDTREGKPVIDWITETGVRHLNISRAHTDCERNRRLMRMPDGLSLDDLHWAISRASGGGTRVRLSCVLLSGEIDTPDKIHSYIDFARRLGVDNVIFRRLMLTDPTTVEPNFVTRFGDRRRVRLEPILDQLDRDPRFRFVRQIVGYYYYVEVWKCGDTDVVFEEADLARLEATKRSTPGIIHELVFHPNARLASTWQPWDGVLGPADLLG